MKLLNFTQTKTQSELHEKIFSKKWLDGAFGLFAEANLESHLE